MARTTLTFTQKKKLVEHYRANPGLRHQDLMGWALSKFGKTIGRSTIGRIIAAPPLTPVNMEAMRLRRQRFPEMEEQLLEFVTLHQASNAISDHVLWQKANELISPSEISLSWVQKFKRRYNIRLRVTHGEAGSVDTAQLEAQRAELQELIEQYDPDDVYNFDETGLFFRMLPSQTLATGKMRGKKKDKARITVALGCNLSGSDKLPPLIIHTSKKPRCFKGVNVERLGVQYHANKKAWMTRSLFLEWAHGFNLRMQDRRVLLLVDNASSHGVVELTNVTIRFLPPNTTSFLQPLDAGIIRSFKCKYKSLFVRWVIDQLEADGAVGSMDVLTAIKFTVDAWGAVAENTIRNCWCHTGIVPAPIAAEIKASNDAIDSDELPELSALIRHLNLDDPLDVQVYVEIEDLPTLYVPNNSEDEASGQDEEDDPDEPDEDVAFSHREALLACQQLAVYAFSQGRVSSEISGLLTHAREMMLLGMQQQKITSFFEAT